MIAPSSLFARAWPAALAALAAVLFVGCAGPARKPIAATPAPVTGEPARGTIDAAWLKPPSTEFRLGPGDHVRVAIAGEPDSAVETVVAPDGKLYYQMLSGIDVWGQTLGEARSALANALKQYYQNSPAVSLTLLEIGSKHVWILGRLGSPGLYPLNGPTTLLDAIAAAGGPGASETVAQLPGGATVTIADPRQDAGDLSQAFVVRQGKPLPVDLKGLRPKCTCSAPWPVRARCGCRVR